MTLTCVEDADLISLPFILQVYLLFPQMIEYGMLNDILRIGVGVILWEERT